MHAIKDDILVKWIAQVQNRLINSGLDPTSKKVCTLSEAIRVIYEESEPIVKNNIPASNHFQINDSWINSSLSLLFEFNSQGSEYICSVIEGITKCLSIQHLLNKFETQMYFRGEHKFGWDLISRFGRKVPDYKTTSWLKTTDMEIRHLKDFQDRVSRTPKLLNEIFGSAKISISEDHPGWWSIMQHYDDDFGTRLIDITSSFFCGLYFACCDWDGSIYDAYDGKLYLYPFEPGRGEVDNPRRCRGAIIDDDDERQNTALKYFDIEDREEIARFRISPLRNNRAIAQDGYFIWQPKFNLPFKIMGNHFPFRVHRNFKKRILKELSALGYTKERILAKYLIFD